MNKYTTANYGDYVAAERVSIRIYKASDIATAHNIADKYPCSGNLVLHRGYWSCINKSMNVIAYQSTILLAPDVLKSAHHNDSSKQSTPLIIAHTSIDKNGGGRSFLLHPEYPCMEPIISSNPRCHSSIFGCQFGIPFIIDGVMYSRPLIGEELLLRYSIPQPLLPHRSVWSLIDPIVDALLPGAFAIGVCLQYCIICF